MWSAGVVLYTMLCGYQPFQADKCVMPLDFINFFSYQELVDLIKEGKVEFHPDPWDNISHHAKDLIKCLLDVNSKSRYSPFQSLTHPWIANVIKLCL